MRKIKVRNYVAGRWVLTAKTDKDGTFLKCKARWVLKGFQDKQKDTQQTDSPAASRAGFRCATQLAANKRWNLFHMDLKTACLQGEAYDETRDIICQIPPEYGYPPYMGARLKKPGYGLNDAPRRWWQIIDGALLRYGLILTRADRCIYILYEGKPKSRVPATAVRSAKTDLNTIEQAIEHLLDPVSQNNAQGRKPHGFICLHVDDLFMGGDKVFEDKILASIRKDFNVGSEDKNDIMFVGQRLKWKTHDKYGPYISADQKLAVDAVEEIKFEKSLKDNIACTPQLHTAYRSVLGQLNWLQSRTQAQLCYKFSRCASAASSPTIGDVREINKVVRTLKNQYVDARFWPLSGTQRILGMPDASYRNNSDKSSQRAHVIFLAEDRKVPSRGQSGQPKNTNHHSRFDCWLWKSQDYDNNSINNCCWTRCFDEVFWNMPFCSCSLGWRQWRDLTDTYKNWCEQSCYYCSNDSFTWTERDTSLDSNVETWEQYRTSWWSFSYCKWILLSRSID